MGMSGGLPLEEEAVILNSPLVHYRFHYRLTTGFAPGIPHFSAISRNVATPFANGLWEAKMLQAIGVKRLSLWLPGGHVNPLVVGSSPTPVTAEPLSHQRLTSTPPHPPPETPSRILAHAGG